MGRGAILPLLDICVQALYVLPIAAQSPSRRVQFLPSTGYDIWVLQLSEHKAEPFLRTPFNESVPTFSPDGHWLAYISDESGRYEVYVQPYPGPGGKYQISTEGGTEPVWNRNGRELFYRSGDKMMAAEINTRGSFSAGKPKVLFAGQYQPSQNPVPSANYDVSSDGQRFLMSSPVGKIRPPHKSTLCQAGLTS
jgi:Tol biopolymer transport system component